MMNVRDQDNLWFLNQIKTILRDDECIITPTEVDDGKTFHIKVRYFGSGIDLRRPMRKIIDVYAGAPERLKGKDILFIVADDDEDIIFDPDAKAPEEL